MTDHVLNKHNAFYARRSWDQAGICSRLTVVLLFSLLRLLVYCMSVVNLTRLSRLGHIISP